MCAFFFFNQQKKKSVDKKMIRNLRGVGIIWSSQKSSSKRFLGGGGGYMQTGWKKRTTKPKILVTGAAGQIGLEIVP